ncbi:MAG: homocysteine S-methyltransferase family protein [Synergistales bacterium]|nr:homocysteine S-methyltransferase family protein [Synergistales bacterium]
MTISFDTLLEQRNTPVLLDGGMGSLLAERGWAPPELPEEMNLRAPETVAEIHRAYAEAGAEIVETNTFGGSPLKLMHRHLDSRTEEINREAARLARRGCRGALVAGAVGPLGTLLEPLGPLSFPEARDAFRRQIRGLLEGGVDLIQIETVLDQREAKAAVAALKDITTAVPFMVSFTFENHGRTVTGFTPAAAAAWAEAVGASAVGANCGVGPAAYIPVVEELASGTVLPVLVYANAGLPEDEDFWSPEDYARTGVELVKAGAAVIGGCCGTTPAYIETLKRAVGSLPLRNPSAPPGARLAGRETVVPCGNGAPLVLIGERINLSRKSTLPDEVRAGDYSGLRREAKLQHQQGATVLNLNLGLPDIDQQGAMEEAVRTTEQTAPLPLSLDSDDTEVLEAGLQACTGVPLINSVNADIHALETGFSLARRYGALLAVLPFTSEGIPEHAEERLAVVRSVLQRAREQGFPAWQLVVDPMVLAAGADFAAPRTTLATLRGISGMGLTSIIGLSNISHGMPGRALLNRVFLAMAAAGGLDMVIADPVAAGIGETTAAADLLTGRDPRGRTFLASMSGTQTTPVAEAALEAPREGATESGATEGEEAEARFATIHTHIVEGVLDGAVEDADRHIRQGTNPLRVINEGVLPALKEVGEYYERGDFFLPQLVASAEVAQRICECCSASLEQRGERQRKATIVLATVEGDLHDLGKNVVATVLRSHGFDVADLGRNVPASTIVEAVRETGAALVGLSALMTTTTKAMEQTIRQLHELFPGLPVVIGGASVNEAFADRADADGYAGDAIQAVSLVQRLLDTASR